MARKRRGGTLQTLAPEPRVEGMATGPWGPGTRWWSCLGCRRTFQITGWLADWHGTWSVWLQKQIEAADGKCWHAGIYWYERPDRLFLGQLVEDGKLMEEM